jgi:hypothetical protein
MNLQHYDLPFSISLGRKENSSSRDSNRRSLQTALKLVRGERRKVQRIHHNLCLCLCLCVVEVWGLAGGRGLQRKVREAAGAWIRVEREREREAQIRV